MKKVFEINDGSVEVLWHDFPTDYWNIIHQTVSEQLDELGGGNATENQIRDYINDQWRKAEEQDLGAKIPDDYWDEYVDDIIRRMKYKDLVKGYDIGINNYCY